MSQMADYPASRVIASPPFTSTSLDYMGPLCIKSNDDADKIRVDLFA